MRTRPRRYRRYGAQMAHPRTFRFGLQLAHGPLRRPTGPSRPARPRTSASRRCSCPITSATSSRPIPALMAAADATTDAQHRRAGLRQRLQAPGRAGQGDRHHRRALRRPARVRPRRRVDEHRLRAVGHPERPARVRIDRWRRARRDRRALRRRRVQLHGQALHITGLDGLPKPVQKPHPPFLIGGGGKRVLRSRRARPTSSASHPCRDRARSTPSRRPRHRTARPTRSWRGYAGAAGDRFDDLELNVSAVRRASPTDDPGPTTRCWPALRHRRPRKAPRFPTCWSAPSTRCARP